MSEVGKQFPSALWQDLRSPYPYRAGDLPAYRGPFVAVIETWPIDCLIAAVGTGQSYLATATDFATGEVLAVLSSRGHPTAADYLALVRKLLKAGPGPSQGSASTELLGVVAFERERIDDFSWLSSRCRQIRVGVVFRHASALQQGRANTAAISASIAVRDEFSPRR